jgi:hypothetical protein
MDNNNQQYNNQFEINQNEIPKQVNVNPRSQYIKQYNGFNNDDISSYNNISNNDGNINNNPQINDRLSFNPLEYIPSQSTVPSQEQQYMPMISPRYSQQQQYNQQHSNSQRYNNNQQQNGIIGNDTNDIMNNRIFNTDYLIQGSLVPINKHHHFSRNLFQEGIPIPQELQGQNNSQQQQLQQQWGQQGYQNGHQFRAKTLYKDELNNRLQNLSPLSDRLYMPIDQQLKTQNQLSASSNSQFLQNQYQQSMILSPEEQKRIMTTSNRGNRRDEMNARMNQFEPLASVMTTSKKNDISGYQPPIPTL